MNKTKDSNALNMSMIGKQMEKREIEKVET